MSGGGKQLCSCQCHWDLSWIGFGLTKIAVTDADGLFLVERCGQFLFIETKRRDEPLGLGQEIMLKALSMKPGFTVILIRGEDNHPETIERFKAGERGEAEPTSREDIQRRVDRWLTACSFK